MRQTWRLGVLAGAVGAACMVGAAPAGAQAVVSNGTISLGVRASGDLNVADAAGRPNYGGVGVQYEPTGFDGTYAGCTCEGWGAGISGGDHDGTWGGANSSVGGVTNLSDITFSSTATTATSAVTIRSGATDVLRVTQLYQPSPATPNLYQVTVTLENLTGATLGEGAQGIRYRRVMDWDIPFPGHEVVTMRGWGADNLIATSSNGFTGSNVFLPLGTICGAPANSNFTDIGPCDHGAAFDFAFPALTAGSSRTFVIFYGAAANLDAARAALGLVEAEVASWAFCGEGRTPGGTFGTCEGADGTTFVFGFQGVGGDPVEPPPGVVPEPGTVLLTATGLIGMLVGVRIRRRRDA
ncbi:MAG TPA: PEP-CTERM sorting domain-containing protein [Gemmatimonadales bacterium]